MAVLKRWKFAARSEQLHGVQRSLLEETIDADLAAIAAELDGAAIPATQAPAPKEQAEAQPLPAHLPRRRECTTSPSTPPAAAAAR